MDKHNNDKGKCARCNGLGYEVIFRRNHKMAYDLAKIDCTWCRGKGHLPSMEDRRKYGLHGKPEGS